MDLQACTQSAKPDAEGPALPDSPRVRVLTGPGAETGRKVVAAARAGAWKGELVFKWV